MIVLYYFYYCSIKKSHKSLCCVKHLNAVLCVTKVNYDKKNVVSKTFF